jgi:uncharacterized protein with HEPN domain
MPREFKKYLCDIHEAAVAIFSFTARLDLQQFAANELVRSAVERKFEVIGEAITQSRHHHPAEILQLGDLKSVVDFRNHIAHRYHLVSHEIVWDIVRNDLPPLKTKVESLLDGFDCLAK